MRSARGEGLRLRVSEEASCDEVVVFDTSEREGDVYCSSDEESELRNNIDWGWYKKEKGTQDGGGGSGSALSGGRGTGGRKKCRMSGVSGGLGCRGVRGRKWVGIGKEAGSRACL